MVQEGRIGDTPGTAGGAAASDVRRDIDAIRSDLARLREDLTAAVSSVVQAGKVQAGDAKERLTHAARSRLDQLGSAWEDATDRGEEAVHMVQEQIEQHPLRSVGIAFGVGLLLGVLVRR